MEVVKYYHPRENPFEVGVIFGERKINQDGSQLELECDVSGLEFVGTPTFKLTLWDGGFGEMFLTRPGSSVLSEVSYRMIMAQINSREDFYRVRQEVEPVVKELLKQLYERHHFE